MYLWPCDASCAWAVTSPLHIIIVTVILTVAIGGIITFTFEAIRLIVKVDVGFFYPSREPSNQLAHYETKIKSEEFNLQRKYFEMLKHL